MEKIKALVTDLSNHISALPTYIYNEGAMSSIEKIAKMLISEVREEEKRRNLTSHSLSINNTSPKEMVSHPDHYQGASYECIDVMLDVYGKEKTLAFCELNAFKYLWRSDSKGTDIQDKSKAIWYLDKYNELKQEELNKKRKLK